MEPSQKKKYITTAGVPMMDPERKIRYIQLYAVVDHEGNLKTRGRGGHLAVYKSYTRACRGAKDEGDSVVGIEVNLSKEPAFINKKTV